MRNLSTPHLSSLIKMLFLNFLRKSGLKGAKGEGSRAAVIIFFLFLFFPVKSALALNSPLLIVEVQIAGEKADNDFIKIYNLGGNDLDISGYRLRKKSSTGKEYSLIVIGRTPKNFRNTIIPAKGYFLWANSKDDFHLTVGADVWSKAYLAKNNSIALLNPENVIIDALAWGKSQNPFVRGSPFPENPTANQRLKRKGFNGNYQDTNNNSQDFYLYPPSEILLPKTESLPGEEAQPTFEAVESKPQQAETIYHSGIIINEILPNTPVGIRDEEGEYIEIFNQNSFEVDLTGWKIEDTIGRTTVYIFSEGTKIGPGEFLVFYRPFTKITLNNDSDGLNLIQPGGKIIDSVSYEKAPRGQSYNRIPSGWVWSAILTPGSANVIPPQKTEETETLEETGKIDINAAPLKDLVKIVHIGEVRAEELISLRPFYSLDDLTRIKGISPKRLEDIKKQGLAWVDPTLEPPQIEKTEPLETGLAAVAEPLKQGHLGKQAPKSLSIFLIAFGLAIFSGAIILILKRKIKERGSL